MCLVAICIACWEKCLFMSFAHFSIEFFCEFFVCFYTYLFLCLFTFGWWVLSVVELAILKPIHRSTDRQSSSCARCQKAFWCHLVDNCSNSNSQVFLSPALQPLELLCPWATCWWDFLPPFALTTKKRPSKWAISLSKPFRALRPSYPMPLLSNTQLLTHPVLTAFFLRHTFLPWGIYAYRCVHR